jgi:glyoxylase-like metal-dependent hydrolase (beta-lactamase superfamily II)
MSGTEGSVLIAHPGGYLQCTSYLIAGPGGSVLVDPGSCAGEDELLAFIERTGPGLAGLRAVLLTHCHVDHARGAYRFRERGVPIFASGLTAAILRTAGPQVWYEFPDYVIPTEIDRELSDGETIDLAGMSIRVLHTPGHAPGSVSYVVETAAGMTVLTGDLITGKGHPGWAGSEGFSVEQSLASVEKLLAAGIDRALWGHGAVAGPAGQWLRSARDLARKGEWVLNAERHPDARPPASFARRSR